MSAIEPRNLPSPGGNRPLMLIISAALLAALVGTQCLRAAGLTPTSDGDAARQREIAGQELDAARQKAIAARADEQSAKAELDDFVARHFDALRSHLPATAPPPAAAAAPQVEASSEIAVLEQQVRTLTTERDQLLRRLTPAHPEVADAEERLATAGERLAALKGTASQAELPPPTDAVPPNPADQAGGEQRRYQEFTAEYERLFKRWQTAQSSLQAAVTAENGALARLSALEAVEACKLVPIPPAQIPPPPPPIDDRNLRSQSLALAALLIALAVAALAAVRLARSDAIFSGVDDVAAALALPVVGVITPSADQAGIVAGRPPMVKVTIVIAELAAAFAAFTLIAYALQNPLTFWEFCTHPLDALRGTADVVGGN